MHVAKFIRAFISDPIGVSNIFPASRALSDQMAYEVDIPERSKIIEVGVGTGALTLSMLSFLNQTHEYLGIEVDPSFYKFLEETFLSKHQKCIQHVKSFEFKKISVEDILNVCDPESVDLVVSSLPWTAFNRDVQHKFLKPIARVLKTGGVFTFYNYIITSKSSKMKNMLDLMNQEFSRVEKGGFVIRNIPPATVWKAYK